MKTIISKLFGDLWRNKGKFFLCILAASLSSWGISTVIYSYLMSERDFKANFSDSQPADIVITLQNPDNELIEGLKKHPLVKTLERREVLSGRIADKNNNRMPFILFAAEDFGQLTLDKFTILDNPQNKENGIFIEKNGKGFLNASSENLDILFPGKEAFITKKGGFVHDARMPPSQMEHAIYGYTKISTIKDFLNPDSKRFLIKTHEKNPDREKLETIVKELKTFIKEKNGNILSIANPPPGEHPHQNIVDGISVLQLSFGFILALLGVALLSLILLTWLYPQIVDIGIMKSLGASTQHIMKAYLAVLGFIIISGMAIGIPLGYLMAGLFNSFIAFVQNFQTVKENFPIGVHLLVMLLCSFVPLLFSIFPLMNASKTSVQNAMNRTFYISQKRIFRFLQKLISSVHIKYVVNNLFRKSQHTLLLITILAVGIALFFTGANLKYSINKDLSHFFREFNYEINLQLVEKQTKKLPFLEALPFIESVSYIGKENVVFQAPNNAHNENSTIKVLSKDYVLSEELLISGKLDKDCEDCIYIHQSFTLDFKNLALGSKIRMVKENGENTSFTFAGIIKEIGVTGCFYRFSKNEDLPYNDMAISLKKSIPLKEAIQKIENLMAENHIEIAHTYDIQHRMAMLEDHLKPTFIIIQVMGLLTVLVALAGVLIVLNLTIQERSKEIGILKAIGSSSTQIARLFYQEYLIINVIAVFIGLFLTVILTYIFCYLFGTMVLRAGISPYFDMPLILISIILLILMQYFMILGYTRLKIKKNVNALFSFVRG